MVHQVYFSLGTNLGDKEANLRTALDEIGKRVGKVISLSAFYKTEPWGFVSTNTFVNAVCLVHTSLLPMEVLQETQIIEKELGRTHKSINGMYNDRLIDIDILLYDELILNSPELTIPHPLMCNRPFVIEPLSEIAPELIHPVTGKKIKEFM